MSAPLRRLGPSVRVLAPLAALLVAAAGCASTLHAHRGLFPTEVDWAETARETSPLALPARFDRIVIGRLEAPTLSADEDEEEAIPIDRDALRLALRDALREGAALPAVSLAEEVPAAEAGHLVIETRLDGALLRRVPHDGWIGSVFLAWYFSGFGATFVHDRSYEMRLDPVFVVRPAPSPSPLLEVRARAGRARDALSFHERRSGGGAVAATLFGAPPFAFDSTPADLASALAPAAWRAPVEDLVARLRSLRAGWRLEKPRPKPQSIVSARVLAPAPGARFERPEAEVRVRVALRPEARGRLRSVTVGGHEEPVSGAVFDRPVRVRLDGPEAGEGQGQGQGRAIAVSVKMEDGTTTAVLEIPVREEVVVPPETEVP